MKNVLIGLLLLPSLSFAGVSATHCKNASKTLLYSLQTVGSAPPQPSISLRGKSVPASDVKFVNIGSVSIYAQTTYAQTSATVMPIVVALVKEGYNNRTFSGCNFLTRSIHK